MSQSASERAKAAARKAAQPVLGRLQAEAEGSLRPQLDAALDEIARLRAELATLRGETQAELELLWAEVEAGKPSAEPGD